MCHVSVNALFVKTLFTLCLVHEEGQNGASKQAFEFRLCKRRRRSLTIIRDVTTEKFRCDRVDMVGKICSPLGWDRVKVS